MFIVSRTHYSWFFQRLWALGMSSGCWIDSSLHPPRQVDSHSQKKMAQSHPYSCEVNFFYFFFFGELKKYTCVKNLLCVWAHVTCVNMWMSRLKKRRTNWASRGLAQSAICELAWVMSWLDEGLHNSSTFAWIRKWVSPHSYGPHELWDNEPRRRATVSWTKSERERAAMSCNS